MISFVMSFYFGDEDSFLTLIHMVGFFEAMSGLNISWSKCQVLGINCDQDKLQRWASVVGCEVGSHPTCYLGLPLGGNLTAVSFWDPIFEKSRNRLGSW